MGRQSIRIISYRPGSIAMSHGSMLDAQKRYGISYYTLCSCLVTGRALDNGVTFDFAMDTPDEVISLVERSYWNVHTSYRRRRPWEH